jgi:cell wall assembly regulator SMI1
MDDLVVAELERTKVILRRSGFELEFGPGAAAPALAECEAVTGIQFDESMRTLFSVIDGSPRRRCLAVQTCWLAPCNFATLSQSLTWWREWLPYDERIHRQFWGDFDERGEAGRDARIQPDYFVHRGWFPFSEWNCWATTVYFDADPTPLGKYGQIIAYQHDPDAVHYLAPNLLEFLRQSNERLEANIDTLLYCDGEPVF